MLDIVPGLMPPAYVLGLMDAKSKKYPNKNKPGFDWVEDPTKKGGGYYRKSRKSSHAAVVGKVAAGIVLAGAGAAAIAAHRRNTITNPSQPPIVPETSPAKRTGINKKAVAGAGLSAIAAVGVGATAVSRMRMKKPQTRVEDKEVSNPWSENSPVETPSPQQTTTQKKTSPSTPTSLPFAKYQTRYPSESDPWERKIPPNSTTSSITPHSEAVVQPQLPPAKPAVYKRQLVPKSPKLRQQINLAKREQTGLKKAQSDLELAQHLQQKTHSPADVMRGVDVEMNAHERIANLQARSPQRTPAGLATIRGKNPNSVRIGGSAEEFRNRKEKEVERANLSLEAQDLISPVETDVESSVSQSKNQSKNQSKGQTQESDARKRKRKSRAENRQLKKELGELTVQSAGRTAWKKSRKTALNAMVPGLGNAVDTAYMLKGNRDKFERWSNSLKEAGDTPITRRQLFRKSGEFVAKETSRNPKSATDELKRGAEVSQDFFNKIFDKNDKIILQGGANRMGGGDKMIHLSPEEFNRITRDYTQADRRALRNFLDLIRFPLP